MSFPLSGAQLKDRLAALGWRPTAKLGQNFLLDGNLARAIVRDAAVERGDLVFEVGCGPGMLTGALLDAGARVLAVEIDPVLAELCGELMGARGELRIIRGSVLEKGRLSPEVTEALAGREFKVVSNLPYSSGTPFLCELAISELAWRSATVMLDAALAARLASAPRTKTYGAPGVLIGSVAGVRRLRAVPADVFWPRPRVESAILSIEPEAGAPAAGLGEAGRGGRGGRRELSVFLQGLFSRRRKMLRNALPGVPGAAGAEALLEALGLDPRARAEDLSPADLVRLFAAVRERNPD